MCFVLLNLAIIGIKVSDERDSLAENSKSIMSDIITFAVKHTMLMQLISGITKSVTKHKVQIVLKIKFYGLCVSPV